MRNPFLIRNSFRMKTIERHATSLSSFSSSSSTIAFTEAQDLLFDRMEQFIAHNSTNTSAKCRLVVAVAGGGTSFTSTLAATPGASSLLLEAITLYDRESFLSFTANVKQQQSSSLSNVKQPKFQFASMTAAQMAATASLQRALELTVGPTTCARPTYKALSYMPHCIGLACASQLSSSSDTDIATTPKSQAHVVAQLPQGATVQMTCSIPSSLSRRQQDIQVAHAMLTCLEYALQLREDDYDNSNNERTTLAALWKERVEQLPVTAVFASVSSSSALKWTETTDQGEERQIQINTVLKDPVIDAAQSIVTGQESVVMLIPQQSQQQNYRVVRGSVATLPPHSLIVPGSFNPPHTGHVQLAVAALQSLKQTSPNPVIWFELSLTNADKPALEPKAAVERVQQFWNLLDELQDYQWGILLTNAPLFAQKIDLLYPMTGKSKKKNATCHVNDGNDDEKLSFCIGTDTLVRLLDPKYYQNSREQMLTTLEQLPCQFVAGGRLDPKQPNVFVTGEVAVAELPPHVASKFTLLPEFRVDISSTEMRRQREIEQQTQT